MSESATEDGRIDELERINHDLARLFNQPPVRLALGAARALADPLVICGILGGKDVGKSTLINALAGSRVSADDAEVGPGTSRPVAYVHEEMIDVVRARFRERGGAALPIDVSTHRVAQILNVVLIDLPDFDSEFVEHRRIVEAVAPLLDRIIWVVTPRKIGDREWLALVREVIKDTRNVHCVLNKVDELLVDDESWSRNGSGNAGTPASTLSGGITSEDAATAAAEQMWRSFHDWVASASGLAPVEMDTPVPDKAGCPGFLVSAAYAGADALTARVACAWDDPDWNRYAGDRAIVARVSALAAGEIARLRECVLSPVSPADAQAIKQANQQRELHTCVARLRDYYRIDDWLDQLEAACDVARQTGVLAEAIEPDYANEVAVRLLRKRKPNSELAETLLSDWVEQWPILRVVYWPLSWLVVRLGRGLARANVEVVASSDDPFEVRGRGLAERLRLLDARVRDDHARLIERFNLGGQLPRIDGLAERVRGSGETLVKQIDRELLARLRRGLRPAAFWKIGLLWGVLLWFPIVQPIAQALLSPFSHGSWSSGLYDIVSVLGAGPLLRGLLLVLVIYVACLAAMYARCIRQIRHARGERAIHGQPAPDAALAPPEAVESASDELVAHILTPYISPFALLRRELAACTERMNRLGRQPSA